MEIQQIFHYLNQNSIPNQESFYGATKPSNEILARGLTSNSEMKTRGLRFFTVYGPNGAPRIWLTLESAKPCLHLNKTFGLFGDGAVKRELHLCRRRSKFSNFSQFKPE
jgi:nucleoside-diphosphate-sugar epimerase